MEDKKRLIKSISITFGILIVLLLVLFFVGKAFGLFSYAKEGQTRSIVTLGGINVTILNDSEDNLDLINGYPIPDSEGLLRNPIEFNIENVGTQKALDITLKLVNDTEAQNNCVIEGTNTPCTELSASKIRYAYKINNGSYSTPANLGENNNIIFNDLIDPQEVMKVSLVIWIDKEAGNEIQGSYFMGNLVITGEKSDSCGDTLCENTDFSDYMTTQDQAIVGQYIEVDMPTVGSSSTGLTGINFYDNWRLAFVRVIEYAKIRDAIVGESYPYPNAMDPQDPWWTGYLTKYNVGIRSGSDMILAEYLDSLVYEQANKHVNAWFATMDFRDYRTRSLGLSGIYVPEGVKWKVISNHPSYGYAEFNMSNTDNTVYLPNIGNYGSATSKYNWGQVGIAYYSATNSSVNNSASAPRPNFTIVYNVDAFKTYLNTLDSSTITSFLWERLFALVECNLPKTKNH